MCGIVGQLNLNGNHVDEFLFNQMRDTLVHRGPDGFGTQLLNSGSVALGHRRLSIIDLSESGKQPMCNEDQTVWLTFNGEIYNFQPLRQELKKKGHVFKSNTDSEVLIHGFEEWGMEDLLKRINGMFAFAIWDEKQKKLWGARDRFGIKPFGYFQNHKYFLFASELKAIYKNHNIPKEIDLSSLASFFTYSYVPSPNSIFKGFKKLPPAHFLEFNTLKNELKVSKYWELRTNENLISDKEALEISDELVKKSVSQHMVSDVPVGVFLSGGIDSSTILSLLKEQSLNTQSFSIGYENSSRSEHIQAKNIANYLGIEHHEHILLESTDYQNTLDTLSKYYDEPFAISSMLPYYFISKFASEKVKVALAGDGADEVFAGYKWYNYIEDYYQKNTLKKGVRHLIKGSKNVDLFLYNNFMTGLGELAYTNNIFSKEIQETVRKEKLNFFKSHFRSDLTPVKRWQYLDAHSFIPEHCLQRADISSMINSLEVRVPFLDHTLMEFTMGLSTKVYKKEGVKKFLLSQNLKRRIPSKLLEMPKRGFSHQHMHKVFESNFSDELFDGVLVENGMIEKSNLKNLKNHNHIFNFHLVMLEKWAKNNWN